MLKRGRGKLVRNLFKAQAKAAAAKREAAKRAEAETAKRAEAEAEAAEQAAEAKRAAEAAKRAAKQAILNLKNNLQNEKDGCILQLSITNCKGLQYTEDTEDSDSIPSKRIRRINALLKQSLSTLVNQDNKLNSSVNETKNNKLEELFKKLLYSFIEELINNIYNNPTDINTYVDNIKHTTITDEKYNDEVKKYINSYYFNGIAILNNNDVKYYKLTNGKYKEYNYSNKDGKLNNFFILRIIDKKIMIHQIYQQIIYALIDTITKDDVLFNKYYNLIKVR